VWLALKVGVFYGAPILAVALAIAYFAVLLVRVRRGTISPRKAAVLYSSTLLFPFAAVIAVWITAELASYLAAASDRSMWDGSVALQFLIDLLPIAVYVGAPIAILVVSFWLTLAALKSS
jgi:hypothetical protein